jgi:hypothetical protein
LRNDGEKKDEEESMLSESHGRSGSSVSRDGARNPLRWWLAAALTLAALAAAAFAPSAHAGTYNVYECYPGVNAGAPDDSFTDTSGGLYLHGADCIAPDNHTGIWIQQSANTFGVPLQANDTFYAPAGTQITDVSTSWWGCSQQGELASVYVYGPGGTSTLASLPFNTCGGGASGGYWITLHAGPGMNATAFQARLACPGYCPWPPHPTYPWVARSYLKYLAFAMRDVSPPAVSLDGSLLGFGERQGVETLAIAASDAGGGVHDAVVRVNGSLVATSTNSSCSASGSGHGAASYRLSPCPASNHWSVALDTSAAPWVNGANTLSVCVEDWATETAPNDTCAQRTVQVDNSCPSSSGAGATSLSAGLEDKAGQLKPSLAVSSNDSPEVRGSLIGGSGPVNAANVCLYERVDAEDGVDRLVKSITTHPDGSFQAQLGPGASRNLSVVYRDHDRMLRRQLYVSAAAVPKFRTGGHLLRNGSFMRFFGSLPGPHADDRGVTIQAKVGHSWRTFKQIKTDADGHYNGRYRFKFSTAPRVTYRFRAVVKKQNGYPFEEGFSPTRKVTVLG